LAWAVNVYVVPGWSRVNVLDVSEIHPVLIRTPSLYT
jgi:hypothetical protein